MPQPQMRRFTTEGERLADRRKYFKHLKRRLYPSERASAISMGKRGKKAQLNSFELPEGYTEYEQMKNWHSFRMRDPKDFASKIYPDHERKTNPPFITRTSHKGQKQVLLGRLKGDPYGKLTVQSIRYKREKP